MNKISLLYPDGVTAVKGGEAVLCGSIGPRTLYHLSLDRSADLFLEEPGDRDVFLKTIAKPLITVRAINYRQAILRDFLANPEFYSGLATVYAQFEGLRQSHIRERQAMMRRVHNTTAGTSADTLKALLMANAVTLGRCLSFIRSISDIFRRTLGHNAELQSEGLKLLKQEADTVSTSEAFEDLIKLCKTFENMGIDDPIDVRVRMNEMGQMEDCSLIDHKFIHIADRDAPRKRLWFLHREDAKAEANCVRLYESQDTTFDKLCAVPMQTLAESIDEISDKLFECFCSAALDMNFYSAAVQYVRFMKKERINYVFPIIGEQGTPFRAMDLSDLHLLLTAATEAEPAPVIPNDVGSETDSRGMIVFGANGSGKTVFLRSVGCAQILAQAGLPVPARNANIPVQTRIVTQFSEAEKEFEKGNDAGRFEQEVRELASVVDSLDDGALVLLNGTFQTTAYEEGAEGLYHILSYFTDRGIRFLLVSHLHQLESRVADDSTGIYRTHDGYKVLPDAK